MIFVDGRPDSGIVEWVKSLFGDDGSSIPSDNKNSAYTNSNIDFTPYLGIGNNFVDSLMPGVKLPSYSSDSSDSSILDNSFTSSPGTDTTYGLQDFYSGLLSSQGAENALNREYNSAEAAANRQFQAMESQIQRDWYERMSNSAYQRAVADMKAAGINPILAYSQGGAATATTGISTGSAASYGVTGGDTVSSLVNGIANLISAVSSSNNKKLDSALKIFKVATKK